MHFYWKPKNTRKLLRPDWITKTIKNVGLNKKKGS